MQANKKFVDPEASPDYAHAHIAKLDAIMAIDPPMRKQVKKSKANEDDLVSIVSRMARGIIGRSSTAKRKKKQTEEGSEITFRF
jgi:hypothetical protein